MMRHRSWLAGLASKIFPRRFAAAKRAARRRPKAPLRSFSDAPLASETLEPRHLLSGVSLVSVDVLAQGNEADGSPTVFELTRTGDTSASLDANVILQGTALPNVDYTAPAGVGVNNTLTVTFDAGSDTTSVSLPTLSDSVIDAYNSVLAVLRSGDGYAIRPGGDRAAAVITAENVAVELDHNIAAFRNYSSFSVLKKDGSIHSWGYYDNSSGSSVPLDNGYVQLFSNASAQAAMKADGSIATWGYGADGGAGGPSDAGYVTIFGNAGAMGAMKPDGSIVTWGQTHYGGTDSAGVPTGDGYIAVAATGTAFAALNVDGTIASWGTYSTDNLIDPPSDSGYVRVVAAADSFAAIKADGSISSWGDGNQGGSGSPDGDGYVQVVGTGNAIAALHKDGTVTSWGTPGEGGDGAPVDGGYVKIFAGWGFIALKEDGSLTAWGHPGYATSELPDNSGFVQVQGNVGIKEDGSLVSLTNSANGGDDLPTQGGFTQIVLTSAAGAALNVDGTVSTWGSVDYGASGGPTDAGYTQLMANENAFAAMKEDGSIFAWGDAVQDGTHGVNGYPTDSGYVAFSNPRTNDVLTIVPNNVPAIDNPGNLANLEGDSVNLPLSATDADGEPLSWTATGLPTDLALDSNTGVISGQLSYQAAGLYNVEVTVTDGLGSSTATFTWDITDKPVATVSIDVTASGNEADGSATIFTLTRTEVIDVELTVNLILQGTAQPGVDYTAPAGLGVNNTLTATFAAGSDTATVSLPTLSDDVIDSYENILAILQSGTDYKILPGSDRADAFITAESLTAKPALNPQYQSTTGGHNLSNGCYAALQSDGTIACWGNDPNIIANTPTGNGFASLVANSYAFAAIHSDGSVVAWGNANAGGSIPSSANLRNVVEIVPSYGSFTALMADGSVYTWGNTNYGGSGSHMPAPESLFNVKQLASNFAAFSAIDESGRIVVWGADWSGRGGNNGYYPPTDSGYIKIEPSNIMFAGLKEDGSVSAWGGSILANHQEIAANIPSGLGYVDVVATTGNSEGSTSFAVLHADGSVVSWGHINHTPPAGDFVDLVPADYAYLALRSDGSVYSWNEAGEIEGPSGSDFVQIFANAAAFTAIRSDGTAVSWGDAAYGGDSSAIVAELTNVTKIIATERAFTALRSDGSYVSWGDAGYGGGHAGSGATEITAISNAFIARNSDGSIESWGSINSSASGNNFVGLINSSVIDSLSFDSFLSVSPTQISEGAGAGAATGTVTRIGSLAGELVVTLASSDTGEATVPATVTIPAGQASASFSIDAVNDDTADLIQPAYITASVADEYYGRVLLEVADDGDGALFIDDGDAGYSSNQSPVVVDTKGYDGDYRWILGTTPDSPYYIQYEATDIAPGEYEISTTWQTQSEISAFQRHPAVKYEIYDGLSLVDMVTVNQRQAPAADYTAGGENFEIIAPSVSIASDNLTVRILVQSPGAGYSNYRTLSADAMRISIAGGVSNTVPVITLLGDSPDSVLVSGTGSYVDPGATASDPQDGDLTGSIVVSGSVDVTTTGTYVLQYDVQDSDGNQAATVTRTVYVIGNAPVFDNQAFSAAENSVSGTVVGTLAATDADGDALTYSITTNADPDGDGNAAFRLEGDQLLVNDTDDLDYETNPQLVIVAEANDGSQSDLADTAEITISIGDINETPLIALLGDASPVFEADNTTSYSDPGATASDDEDGNLTGSILVSGDVVDLSVPDTYLIDYDVQDSAGNDAETVTRTVLVQDTLKPVISLVDGMTVTVIENVSEGFIDPGFIASDSLDGDLTSSVVVSGVVDRTQAGTYQLSYDVADAAGNTAETVIRTVTVVANQASGLQIIDDGDPGYSSNQSPVTVTGQGYENDYQWILGTTPDSPYYIEYEATGLNQGYYEIATTWQTESEIGSYLRHEAVHYEIYDGDNLLETVTVNQRLSPAADYVEGGENFEVIASGVPVVSDSLAVKILVQSPGVGASNYRTVSADAVRIASSTVPVITLLGDSPDSVLVSGTGSYIDPGATASDPQDGDLTGSIVVSGSVDVTTTGTYVLQYDVQDSDGNQAAAVTRTVYVIGNAPVFDNQAFIAAENSVDGTVVGTLVATDADGDPLTYSIAVNVDPDGDGNAAFRLEGDQLLVNDTDDLDYETNPQLVIVAEANDGSQSDLADTAEITISIGDDINETPLIALLGDASPVFEADNTTSYSDPGATASDDEDGNLTGSILVSGDVVDLSVPGTYLIDYDVQDSAGNDAETVTRTVLVQDTIAPVITLTGDAEITLIVDPNGTYSDPGFIASDSLDGDLTGSVVVSGVVGRTQVGTYQLSYDVADAAGNTAETVIRTVTVVANQASGLQIIDDGDPGYSSNQSPVVVDTKGYDGDYRWILGTTPDSPYYIEYEATGLNQGYYEIAITWQTESEIGSYLRHEAVQYEIYDGESLVETVTVNQRLSPAADYVEGGENFEVVASGVPVVSNSLAVRILVQSPGVGASNYRTISADAVLLMADDGTPPALEDQWFTVAETSVSATVVGTLTATDPDGDSLIYSIAANVDPDGDGNAAFRIEGDQLLVNDADDLDYEANPQLVITAEASDGSLTDTAQITVNVTDVNENPVAMDDAHQVLANAELTVGAAGVLGNDTDADGDALTAVLVSSTSNGILSFNADGSFTYTSDANFAGDDTFTYQVSDGTNLSNVATVTISVIPYVTFENPTNSDYADFGWSTAIDGDRVLIGTPRGVAFGTEIGKAHLFDLQGNLLQTFDDPVLTTEDWFGASVAISGDYVLISDSGDDTAGTNIGQAHLFDAATGNLLHTFSDPTPTTEDHFGAFVAIEGGQILIGDYRDDTAAENSGQVHLFDAASRSLLRTIQNPNTTTPSNNRFGSAGDISDGRILVGATNDGIGRAHLFDASDGSLLHSFDDPTADNKDYFASSVALDGNYIVIGAFEDDSLLPSAGQAYVFDATTGLLLHTLDNPEPNNMEWFGEAVAIDGSRIVVGAMLNRVDGHQIGEAYLFDAVSGDLVRTFEEPTPTEFDSFGHGVAIDGDHVLIGAYHHRNTELDIATGEAYLYHLAAGTPPVFDNQSLSVPENSVSGTVIGTLVATDADGDALTYAITTNVDPDSDGNDAFRIEGDGLLVNDADDFDFETNPQLVITAQASDGSLSDTAQITINLADVDEAPTLDPVSDVSIDEDSGELIVSLTGISSGDGTPQLVQITAASNNPNLISDPTISHTPPSETASLSITPEDNKHGAAEITIVVEDAGLDNDLATTADNLTFTQTFTVTVHSVDDTPIFDDQTFTIAENTADGTVIGTLTASDSADQLVYLMDNEDPGFTNMGGTVSTASGYGGSYVWTIPTDFLQTPFGFTFTDLPAADYDIAASWQSGPGEVNGVDRNDSTKFIAVDDVTPTASFTVNQQNWPTPDHVEDSFNFQTIGTGVTVNSGTLAVGVRSGLDGLSNLINADAIRISADNPLTYTITGNYDTDNDGSLAFRVEGNQLLVNDADDLDYEVIDQLTMVVSASDGSLDDDATITVNLTDVADTPATISGTSWNDLNADSVWDEGELGHAGWTIYIDTNINGQLDSGEVTTTTDANGNYSFTGLDPGVYVIAEVPQAGWLQTYPDDNSAGSSSAQGSLQSTGIAGNPPEDLDADGITTESSLETQGVGVPEMVIVADPFFEPLNNAMVLEMGSLQPAGYSLEETFLLHSNPGASKIIYLDFDGHTTSGTPFNYGYGDPIITPAYSFEGDSSHSDAEKQRIQNIWERVAEDFVPFDVNVTTEDPGVEALQNTGAGDVEWGIRVVIGDDTFHPGDHGGVANMHSFTDATDTPCFVFADTLSNGNEKYTAECISHEVGHTLGLHHDGDSTEVYYWGHGGGANGWAPIMGSGYTRNLTQWSLGEYPDANNAEDDLAIITDANGFDYLADDHEGNTAYASLLGVTAGTTVFDEGIIERNTDLDYFAFTTAPGTISLDIDPFYRGPNLDILATLYDASGVALATSNPTGSLNATFNMSVDGGTYYISVDGTGEGDLISGYSDYGSLGYYSISGTILNGDLPGTHTAVVSYADAITDLNFGNWSNVAPVFADQTMSVAENSADGTLVGTLAATDANSDSITYSIISNVDPDGDGNDAFRIEGDQLLVNDADELTMAAGHAFPELEGWYVRANDGEAIPIIEESFRTIRYENTAHRYVLWIEDWIDWDFDTRLTATRLGSGEVHIEYEKVSSTVSSHTLYDENNTAMLSIDANESVGSAVSVTLEGASTLNDFSLEVVATESSGTLSDTAIVTVNVTAVSNDPVIVDDGDAGFAESGFTQQSNAQVAAAYDSDVHHMQGGSGEASWTFTGLPADRYQVAATWAYKYNNNYNATDAPFTLSDGAGGVFSTQIVNQKLTPSEFEDAGYLWDTLDTVEVSGGTLVVTLGAGSASNKYVVADAIRVSVAATLTLSINDASVAESAGTAATTATVTRNGPTDYPVDVDLLVSDATEISVPATVTIPAGQASVAFSIDAVDDVFFDGTQSVNVLATAIGYSDGSDSLEILDDETSHTALIDDGEAGFAQSGFTYQNNAQVAAAYNGDNYNLRNGDDADQASWTFTGLDDGAYHVMATWAHKYNNNYNATDAPFQILDAGSNVLSSVAINQKNAPSQHDVGGYFWDTLDTVYVAGGELTVTVGATAQANKFVVADAVRIEQLVQPSSTLVVQLGEEIVDEDAGSVTGIVSRGAETVGDLIVTLGSDDTAVGTVPATVTIPDGAGAVPFTLTVVDDAVVDGDQQVAVTATAAGYIDGTDSLLVEDDEFPPVQVIDNGDAGFTVTGAFKSRTWATAYEGDNHNMRGSDGEARWTFTDLIDGEYTASVTWDHISSNVYNATDAPFTIRNAADEQLLAASIDQTLSPADFSDGVTDWHTLGTVYVIDGELTVSLTEALVNKYVVADAVRIEIDTNPTSKLLVILDESSVSEAGTLNGKVIRTGDTAGSLTVNLASDNAAAATVPATITLGEGARYGTFAITPTDDSAPDGTQVANIAASAAGFTAGTAAVDVLDDDATILFIDDREDGFVADAGFKRRNVPGAYGNNNHYMRGGTGEASWTFTGLEEGQYFVSATWNHVYENRYNTERAPFSIRNGSGNLLATTIVDQTQTPADFTDGGYGWEALAPVYINDGTLIVTLGASSTNHYAVADAIRIELNESLAPSLFVLVDSESESAGASNGTIIRTGDTSSAATVNFTSSNLDAATVESSITFDAWEGTKSFIVTPIDDSSPNGIRQTLIEATAAGYAAGTALMNVEDDDALSVAIMDNTDSGFTSNGFRYNANKQVSQAYGGNNESLKGGEPGEEASWTFTGLADGVYHVSATWNHKYDNNYNATDAQYSITNAGDEALATTTINQSNAPSEFLDNGIAWGTLETVTVTGGELIVTVSGGSNPNRHTVADAVRIARVAEVGGSSMRMAEADPFDGSLMDPLEDALDDLAGEWGETSADEESLLWGE